MAGLILLKINLTSLSNLFVAVESFIISEVAGPAAYTLVS